MVNSYLAAAKAPEASLPTTKLLLHDQQKKYPGKSNANLVYPGCAGTDLEARRTYKDLTKAF
jgi:hypothetical protein